MTDQSTSSTEPADPTRSSWPRTSGRPARFKGLDRPDPAIAAAKAEAREAIPQIYAGLPEAVKAIDGLDRGRRRIYDLSDEPLEDGDPLMTAAALADRTADRGGARLIDLLADDDTDVDIVIDMAVDTARAHDDAADDDSDGIEL